MSAILLVLGGAAAGWLARCRGERAARLALFRRRGEVRAWRTRLDARRRAKTVRA